MKIIRSLHPESTLLKANTPGSRINDELNDEVPNQKRLLDQEYASIYEVIAMMRLRSLVEVLHAKDHGIAAFEIENANLKVLET